MKKLFLIGAAALIAFGFSACSLDHINPDQPPIISTGKSDTSKTPIANTSLVGTWNIITDSISYQTNTMYHGTPSDIYKFTQYGNLYVNNGFNAQIDTAVYAISTDNKLQFTTSYWSANGNYSRVPLAVGPFQISNLTSTTLTLTQNVKSTNGNYYEQLIFAKVQ
ncbi:MAG TPA: hypothetical protein VK668_06300 [Mucilaginibacter sp.]|nr:hypothetical protein [Mucilaginibacter sp.]